MAKNAQKLVIRRLFVVVARFSSQESSCLLTFSKRSIASHNPKVVGSNPAPATNIRTTDRDVGSPFFFCLYGVMRIRESVM